MFDQILAALGARRSGIGWHGQCPVCSPRRPCLGLWIGADGALMCRCHRSGCSWRKIAAAIGTTAVDWYPEHLRKGRAVTKAPERRIVAKYDYLTADGRLRYQVVRFEPKAFSQRRPDPAGGWIWDMSGVEPLPYHLPQLLAHDDWPVVIVEGEKDADLLISLGGKWVATTSHGGAGKFAWDLVRWFAHRRVVIIPDSDEAGRRHAFDVTGKLMRAPVGAVRMVHLPIGFKDVSEFLANVPQASRARAFANLVRRPADEPVVECKVEQQWA